MWGKRQFDAQELGCPTTFSPYILFYFILKLIQAIQNKFESFLKRKGLFFGAAKRSLKRTKENSEFLYTFIYFLPFSGRFFFFHG